MVVSLVGYSNIKLLRALELVSLETSFSVHICLGLTPSTNVHAERRFSTHNSSIGL